MVVVVLWDPRRIFVHPHTRSTAGGGGRIDGIGCIVSIRCASNSTAVRDHTHTHTRAARCVGGRYHSERFWVAVPGTHVASLCVRIQPHADEAAVDEQARRILAPHFAHVTVQIEKDPDNMAHWIGSSSSSSGGGGGGGSSSHVDVAP